MTFLPIVVRELRTAARLQATYRNRVLAAGVVFVFVASFMLFESATSMRPFGPMRGRAIFRMLTSVAFLFCHLEALSRTPDCLSSEKRDGTLGLLFLTDLKGYDIVLGKLVSTSLQSFYGLLAILPLMGLPLLMGGVTGQEFWRVVLALIIILFFLLAVGMLVSGVCREKRTAMGAVVVIFVLFDFVPRYVPVPLVKALSPANLLNVALTDYRLTPTVDYLAAAGVVSLLGCVALIGASLAVPRFWQEGEARGTIHAWFRGGIALRRPQSPEDRREQLTQNPILWLTKRKIKISRWELILVGIIVAFEAGMLANPIRRGFPPPMVLFFLLPQFALLLLLAFHAPRFFIEGRRIGTLELLFTTPLKTDEILAGQRLAMQKSFAPPIGIMLFLEAVLAGAVDSSGTALIIFLLFACFYILQSFAVVNAGMWFGLICKNESAAATRTILLVLVLPFVCMPFCIFGAPFVIGIPLFWSAYASSKLRAELRTRAAMPIG